MLAYPQLRVFYFSGTGNARQTAHWMAQRAQQLGAQAHVYNIEEQAEWPTSLPPDALVVVCAPTHGFNLPPIVWQFLVRVPPLGGRAVAVVNTRAGMKLGSLFLPGLSGVALWLAAVWLWLRGGRIRGLFSVDLPSNWISLHPGLGPRTVESIVAHWRPLVGYRAEALLHGQRIWRGLRSLPIDLALAPIALLYYLVGRFVLAKTFVATQACNQCGLCVRQCPVQAIRPGRVLSWHYRCESCMRCLNHCPHQAIQTTHGWSLGWWVLLFGSLPAWFWAGWNSWFAAPTQPLQWLLELALWMVAVLLLFVSYRLGIYLLRYRWFDWLLRHTSATHLSWWRRYRFPRSARSEIDVSA